MRKITQIGFVALVSLMLLATACKKSSSDQLYKTWNLDSVEMPDADSVTLAAINDQGIEFTFSKGGDFKMTGALTGEGTFEINEEATFMSTTVEGNTDMYTVALTENTLQMIKGGDKMTFTSKK